MNPTGIDELRAAVKALNSCKEWFLNQFDTKELLAIYRAWVSSDWDVSPDNWTGRQVKQAIRGRAPRWDSDGKPVYSPRKRRATVLAADRGAA